MASQIAVGDVVQLKSGSIEMTVTEISEDDDECKCEWFTEQDEPKLKWFQRAALKRV